MQINSMLLSREGVDIGLFITLVPKFYENVFLLVCLTTSTVLIYLLNKLSVQTFKPLFITYRRRNFVYHHQECTSIYQPQSYPFRSLAFISLKNKYLAFAAILRGHLVLASAADVPARVDLLLRQTSAGYDRVEVVHGTIYYPKIKQKLIKLLKMSPKKGETTLQRLAKLFRVTSYQKEI